MSESIWPVAAGAIALSPGSALAQGVTDRGWFWDYGWGMGGMLFGGGLLMLVFWGAVIVLIVLLVGRLGGLGPPDSMGRPRSTALDILQERYARGEIDKQEYDERRRTLTGG
jgi:putative membrane protein